MESLAIVQSTGFVLGPVALTIAIGALAAAVGWRSVRLVRMRRGINAGLRDDDPDIRIAAVEQAAEIGLAATAPALLRAVREETRPRGPGLGRARGRDPAVGARFDRPASSSSGCGPRRTPSVIPSCAGAT